MSDLTPMAVSDEFEHCNLCGGNSDTPHPTEDRKMTGREWCEYFKECAAEIDWEKVYGNDGT